MPRRSQPHSRYEGSRKLIGRRRLPANCIDADLANEDTFGVGSVGNDWVPDGAHSLFEQQRVAARQREGLASSENATISNLHMRVEKDALIQPQSEVSRHLSIEKLSFLETMDNVLPRESSPRSPPFISAKSVSPLEESQPRPQSISLVTAKLQAMMARGYSGMNDSSMRTSETQDSHRNEGVESMHTTQTLSSHNTPAPMQFSSFSTTTPPMQSSSVVLQSSITPSRISISPLPHEELSIQENLSIPTRPFSKVSPDFLNSTSVEKLMPARIGPPPGYTSISYNAPPPPPPPSSSSSLASAVAFDLLPADEMPEFPSHPHVFFTTKREDADLCPSISSHTNDFSYSNQASFSPIPFISKPASTSILPSLHTFSEYPTPSHTLPFITSASADTSAPHSSVPHHFPSSEYLTSPTSSFSSLPATSRYLSLPSWLPQLSSSDEYAPSFQSSSFHSPVTESIPTQPSLLPAESESTTFSGSTHTSNEKSIHLMNLLKIDSGGGPPMAAPSAPTAKETLLPIGASSFNQNSRVVKQVPQRLPPPLPSPPAFLPPVLSPKARIPSSRGSHLPSTDTSHQSDRLASQKRISGRWQPMKNHQPLPPSEQANPSPPLLAGVPMLSEDRKVAFTRKGGKMFSRHSPPLPPSSLPTPPSVMPRISPFTERHRTLLITFKTLEASISYFKWPLYLEEKEGHTSLMTSNELDTIVRIQFSQMAEAPYAVGRFQCLKKLKRPPSLDPSALESPPVVPSIPFKKEVELTSNTKPTEERGFLPSLSRMHHFLIGLASLRPLEKLNVHAKEMDVKKVEDTLPDASLAELSKTNASASITTVTKKKEKKGSFLNDDPFSSSPIVNVAVESDASVRSPSPLASIEEVPAEIDSGLKKFGKMSYCTVRQPKAMLACNGVSLAARSHFEKQPFTLSELVSDKLSPRDVSFLCRSIIEDAYDLLFTVSDLQEEIESFPFQHGPTLEKMQHKYKEALEELYEILTLRPADSEKGFLEISSIPSASSHPTIWLISHLLSFPKGQRILCMASTLLPDPHLSIFLQTIVASPSIFLSLLDAANTWKLTTDDSNSILFSEMTEQLYQLENATVSVESQKEGDGSGDDDLLVFLVSKSPLSHLFVVLMAIFKKISNRPEGKKLFFHAVNIFLWNHSSEESVMALFGYSSGVLFLTFLCRRLLYSLKHENAALSVSKAFLKQIGVALIRYIAIYSPTHALNSQEESPISLNKQRLLETHLLLQNLLIFFKEVPTFKEILTAIIAQSLDKSVVSKFLEAIQQSF